MPENSNLILTDGLDGFHRVYRFLKQISYCLHHGDVAHRDFVRVEGNPEACCTTLTGKGGLFLISSIGSSTI
jgi:hypothetical protein